MRLPIFKQQHSTFATFIIEPRVVASSSVGISYSLVCSLGAGLAWVGLGCSGGSTRLPPMWTMWPVFDSQTRHHMWVEFVGFVLCSERFFPRGLRLSLPASKTNNLI